jgi:hypothetical protein
MSSSGRYDLEIGFLNVSERRGFESGINGRILFLFGSPHDLHPIGGVFVSFKVN